MKPGPEVTIKPLSIRGITLWHIPLLFEKKGIGTHPSSRIGAGVDIEKVKPLEAGEDYSFFSPHHSAQFGAPWGVFFRRQEEIRLILILDLPNAIDFGDPPKRISLLTLALTLSTLATAQPNEGRVNIIALGAREYTSELIQNNTQLGVEISRILGLSSRKQRGYALSDALKKQCVHDRENLIVVLSDFLIHPQSEEWSRLSEAYHSAARFGHEVLFLRALDIKERCLPGGGSVKVGSLDGRSLWAGLGTNNRVRLFQADISARLHEIVGKPELRLLELVTPADNLEEFLKAFLKKRERYTKTYFAAASSS